MKRQVIVLGVKLSVHFSTPAEEEWWHRDGVLVRRVLHDFDLSHYRYQRFDPLLKMVSALLATMKSFFLSL